nr:hypothetical protein [Pseudomonas syringae]QOQ33371.1 hypothetical protein [Pseudomonas syringae pv. actinidiae]
MKTGKIHGYAASCFYGNARNMKKMAASPLAPQAKNEAKRYGFGKG